MKLSFYTLNIVHKKGIYR